MRIEVLGKNGFHPSDANKEYAIKKISEIQNYFSDDVEIDARVVCKVYKDKHKVEVTIPSKNLIMRAEASDYDLYAAIDKAFDKLATQIKKHKERVKSKLDKTSIKHMLTNDHTNDYLDDKNFVEVYEGKVVRSKKLELKPMTLNDALEQMLLLDHTFFVYFDIDTDSVNVVYKRYDGDYAVLETA